jgi:hypothetical protein
MDERLRPVPVVATFARRVRPVADVLGLCAGGSLASGGFRPGRSDLDLVAGPPGSSTSRRASGWVALHRALRRADPTAGGLHCACVPRRDAHDVAAEHLTRAHGELHSRGLSGIARAELLQGGITVLGPGPGQFLPPVDDAALRAAARAGPSPAASAP